MGSAVGVAVVVSGVVTFWHEQKSITRTSKSDKSRICFFMGCLLFLKKRSKAVVFCILLKNDYITPPREMQWVLLKKANFFMGFHRKKAGVAFASCAKRENML